MVCTLIIRCMLMVKPIGILNKAKGDLTGDVSESLHPLTFLYKITTIKIIMKKYLRKITIKIFLKIIIILIVNIQNLYKVMYTKYKTGKRKIKI